MRKSAKKILKTVIENVLCKSGDSALILYSRPVYPGNGGNNERD